MPHRVQDIIPSNRRTIRDIPIEDASLKEDVRSDELPKKAEKIYKSQKMDDVRPKSRARSDDNEIVHIHKIDAHKDPAYSNDAPNAPNVSDVSEPEDERPSNIRRMPITPLPKRRSAKKFPWIVAVVGGIILVAGFAFALSDHFAKATFVIVPRSISVQVNGTYVIPAMAGPGSPLAYRIITATSVASTTVPAVLSGNISTKAGGTVTIYNDYSSQSQRLVAGTRLTGMSGLVYRLTSSVVVPGRVSSGGNDVPGKTSATIIADQPGAAYNISSSDSVSDLHIIAYKGTSKYSTIYGQLSSDVIGGFSGAHSTVSTGTLASTSAKLQSALLISLLDKMNHSVPAGYLMYDNAYVQSFSSSSVSSLGSTTSSVSVRGTLYGIVFKTSDLAAMLAGASSTASFGSFSYDAPGLETLSFSIANAKDFSPTAQNSLVAKMSGSFKVVGSIPSDALKKALAGSSLSGTGLILNKYASVIDIQDSFGEMAPPWVGVVPSDVSHISINIRKP